MSDAYFPILPTPPAPTPEDALPADVTEIAPAYEVESDHVASGIDLLIEQYRGRPRIEGLIAAMLGESQSVEDAFAELAIEGNVDTAAGAQLDILGRIVGQERLALDDETFRTFIRVRVRVNRSNGTPEDIHSIFRLLYPDVGDFQIVEYPPAAFELVMNVEPMHELSLLASLLRQSKATGVRADLISPESDPEDAFRFASTFAAEPETSTDAGFGDWDDTDGDGGRWGTSTRA